MTHHTFMLLLASTTPVAANTSPVQELRSRVDRAVQVLNDPATKGPEKVLERRAKVRKIADEIFDFSEMGKRSLGPHWAQLPAGDRERFIRLYADLLDRAYFEKIDSYNGEKVRYLEPRIEGDQATVATRVVTPKGTDIPVDYRMHRAEGRWMVHDVLIEGVSLVANYRAQFDRIIRTSSAADLIKRMEAQVAGQASPAGAAERKPRGAGRE
jgi:phospholipid transport system substrate-binding protein